MCTSLKGPSPLRWPNAAMPKSSANLKRSSVPAAWMRLEVIKPFDRNRAEPPKTASWKSWENRITVQIFPPSRVDLEVARRTIIRDLEELIRRGQLKPEIYREVRNALAGRVDLTLQTTQRHPAPVQPRPPPAIPKSSVPVRVEKPIPGKPAVCRGGKVDFGSSRCEFKDLASRSRRANKSPALLKASPPGLSPKPPKSALHVPRA